MRSIALMNQKGGVGKTTTTLSLGAALAEAGQRVALIDLDPQAHLTLNLGLPISGETESIYEVLIDSLPLERVARTVGGMTVVPASVHLAGAEIELVSAIGRETILKDRLEEWKAEFDYLLLDCPPSLGLLSLNGLAAAGEVLIPMNPHFLALQGVARLVDTVERISRRLNPTLRVSGFILTMFDGQARLSNEIVGELEEFVSEARGQNRPWSGARVFATRIRRNIKLAECPGFGKSIFEYDGQSNGAADYRALAAEVLSMASPAEVRGPVPGNEAGVA
jgi:chromosome partitioning protein